MSSRFFVKGDKMYIEIGKILKPQGIKGELKVLPLSEPEYLKSVELVKVGGRQAKILSCSLREGYAFIMLDICKNRDDAEGLRDFIIEVEKDVLPDLEEGQYFYEDLIGCEVYFEDGEKLGEILDIVNYGASDVFEIKDGYGSVDCPFVDGVFVEIDVKKKKIIANRKRFDEVTKYED